MGWVTAAREQCSQRGKPTLGSNTERGTCPMRIPNSIMNSTNGSNRVIRTRTYRKNHSSFDSFRNAALPKTPFRPSNANRHPEMSCRFRKCSLLTSSVPTVPSSPKVDDNYGVHPNELRILEGMFADARICTTKRNASNLNRHYCHCRFDVDSDSRAEHITDGDISEQPWVTNATSNNEFWIDIEMTKLCRSGTGTGNFGEINRH